MNAGGKRKSKPPIHVRVEKLVRPETGELVGAFVPLNGIDGAMCRERGYSEGSELKAQFVKARKLRFWRLAHVVGKWLSENVDDYAGLDAHAALKRLQRKSRIGCEEYSVRVPGHFTMRVYQPLSLNFDDMDEGEFRMLWDGGHESRGNGGWIGYLRRTHWGNLLEVSVADIEIIITGERQFWSA